MQPRQDLLKAEKSSPNYDMYTTFTKSFQFISDRHASTKTKDKRQPGTLCNKKSEVLMSKSKIRRKCCN